MALDTNIYRINETNDTLRRVYFDLLKDDVALITEGGNQPQISVTGASWQDTGIGTLTHVGSGLYYATLTQGILADRDNIIHTRYSIAPSSYEFRGTTARVVDDMDGFTQEQVLKLCLAFIAGQTVGGGTPNIIFKNPSGIDSRISMTVDGSGNRTGISFNFDTAA